MAYESVIEAIIVLEPGDDSDDQERDELTRRLRQRLEEADFEKVLSVQAQLPPGAKVVDAVTIGALAVTLLPTAVPRLIDVLKTWVLDRKKHPLKITFSNNRGDKLALEAPSGVLTARELDKILALVQQPALPKEADS